MSRIEEILRDTSLPGRRASLDGLNGLAIFTICSNNYISMASILIASAKRFHSDATIYLCLADALLPNEGFYPDGCVVVPIADLDIPDLRSFVFRYDIMELNTAVKPFMFQHLLRMGHAIVLYFDPDIQIFSRLDQVLEPLREGASFVLTPRLWSTPGVRRLLMTFRAAKFGRELLCNFFSFRAFSRRSLLGSPAATRSCETVLDYQGELSGQLSTSSIIADFQTFYYLRIRQVPKAFRLNGMARDSASIHNNRGN